MLDLGQQLTPYDGGEVTGSFGDINVGWSIQVSIMTGWQQVVFLALKVVPLLVTATLWWTLASVVKQSRSQSAFTRANARRLTVAGSVVAMGAPLLALATWGHHRWVLSTAQLREFVIPPNFDLSFMPWTAIAAGIALVVLGSVWRRGVAIQQDVDGLV